VQLDLFCSIFPSLLSTMQEIEQNYLKGGQLLSLLFEEQQSGNPLLKTMYSKLLFSCHEVFFHQVNSFIVHGELIDIQEEFFIIKMDS